MLIQAQHYAAPVILSPVTMYSAVLRANTSAAVCRLVRPPARLSSRSLLWWCDGRIPSTQICLLYVQSPALAREKQDRLFETGPMVYIAHEMTPSHPKTLLCTPIVTRCGLLIIKVADMDLHQAGNKRRNALTRYYIQRYIRLHDRQKTCLWERRNRTRCSYYWRHHRWKSSCHARSTTGPASRESATLGWQWKHWLKADGSDFVTVVAAIADKNRNIKRLNNYYVKFHVEGEGRILGGANILANRLR